MGGTANYNLFVYASENSDANAAINKVWGKHLIATGFEFMKRYLNVGQPPAPAGAYGFDLSATDQQTTPTSASGLPVGGSDFASILVGMGMSPGSEATLGYPGNFSKDVFLAESNPYYGAFVEDTYHASKILTITAGLRWDIFGGRNERHNRQEYFNPTINNTLNGVSYTGVLKSTSTVAIARHSPRICTILDLGWLSPGSPLPIWWCGAAQASTTGPVRTTSLTPLTPMASRPGAHGMAPALTPTTIRCSGA